MRGTTSVMCTTLGAVRQKLAHSICPPYFIQADGMGALSALVAVVGPPCVEVEDALEMGLWLLQVGPINYLEKKELRCQ
jgi:hypothetical protein